MMYYHTITTIINEKGRHLGQYQWSCLDTEKKIKAVRFRDGERKDCDLISDAKMFICDAEHLTPEMQQISSVSALEPV